MIIAVNFPHLKGPLSRWSACAVLVNSIFITNRNRDTITSAPSQPKFQVPFENIFIRRILSFCLWRIFIMFMLCEGRVRWIQAHTFYFLLTCIHSCSYKKFPLFALPSFLPSSFRLQPLRKPSFEDIVFLDGFQLKTQNMPCTSIMVD